MTYPLGDCCGVECEHGAHPNALPNHSCSNGVVVYHWKGGGILSVLEVNSDDY